MFKEIIIGTGCKEEIKHYDIVFPEEADDALLSEAATIINEYAWQGLMLAVTTEQLAQVAAQGLLALALNQSGRVVGTAAIMFQYPDGICEFGA